MVTVNETEDNVGASIGVASYDNPPAYTYPHGDATQLQGNVSQKMTAKPSVEQPTIYNYVNPVTGQHVASLLPPDHPEMVCLQAGSHVPQTRFGLLGILAAVFWFPLGIGLALVDRRVKCTRCGVVIENGITCG
ncbi:hypothetical protein M413DRAFT_442162 [Hebeloma cylindrosporum]|uniref:Uncharacterized protein n=1 Tax=Hebeloma cylindrosporum TaxID=76867 RepID=A0A0C3C9I6_HEBCY|nr:hypothetical protein M413DRAFT_442162 [Hebeloma cylindrosporum h7]